MASTIKLKNGSGAPLASDLVQGEPALDLTNKRLYTEDSLGTVIEVGTNPTSLTTGDITTTGAVDVTGDLDVDNINIDGNTISSTDTNGNIAITPNGTGEVDISKVDIDGGAIDGTVIGGTTTAAGSFTTLQADTSLNVDGTVTADGATIDDLIIDRVTSPVDYTELRKTTTGSNLSITTQESMYLHLDANDDQTNRSITIASDTSQPGQGKKLFVAQEGGDISFYEDTGTTAKFFWDASAESLGIGTTSPAANIEVNTGAASDPIIQVTNSNAASYRPSVRVDNQHTGGRSYRMFSTADGDGVFGGGKFVIYDDDAGLGRITLDNGGNLGIGTSSPNALLDCNKSTGDLAVRVRVGDSGSAATLYQNITTGTGGTDGLFVGIGSGEQGYLYHYGNFPLIFGTNNTERMRIDSSGNLLVGKTATSSDTAGITLNSNGAGWFTGDGIRPLLINRKSSDGDILEFRKDGSTVGSIGAVTLAGATNTLIDSPNAVYFGTNARPETDDLYDIGSASYRWDDIFATNGTIQTSDRNEKQDIEELSDAEQRVAVAAKALMRKFRWKDAVEEKGDDARIHFGIIAQDLQAAFEAEGLDAGRYAMFISSTWWETQTEVPAVEAQDAVYETVTIPAVTEERLVSEAVYDDEGNEVEAAVYETVVIEEERTEERLVSEAVEAQEAYTRTDTYDTAEEAPEGAVERTRLGVRYSELLAFIIAAI